MFAADNRAGEQGRGDGASDEVYAILEAANDLRDHETADACRRIIEANKAGTSVSPTDMRMILNYFR